MKILRVLFSSVAAYVAGASTAHAGIESLIAAAIQGFLLSSTAIAATVTGTIATVAASVIVNGALLGGMMLFGKQTGTVKASDAKATFEGDESSVIEGLGRVMVGGMKAFGNTDGSTRWRLICRLQGPIDAIEQYYVGGREVTVDPDGWVSSPPWARNGSGWMKWESKLGTGVETAWPALIDTFPTLWTSAHRVRGIAQSLLTFINPGLSSSRFLTLYSGGVPETQQVCRASKVYDPLDETQLVDDPSTWRWTDCGIACAIHVLRRDPAFTSDRFDWVLNSLQMVKARSYVATKTGPTKRAQCWGMFAYEGGRRDTMQDILDSIGAEIRVTAAGKIWFELIDDDPAPEIAFTPKHGYQLEWASGPEAVERYNICRLSYYSPERNYEMAEIDLTGIAWAQIDDEVARYGPKIFDCKLPYQPNSSIAQRIARRKFAQVRGETGLMLTNMVGLAAWGVLYGTVELPDLGDVLKVRIMPPRIDDANAAVEIPFSVWPSLSAWNPETDEADAPDEIPDLTYVSDVETPAMPTSATQITYPGGAKEFRVSYTLPIDRDSSEATYRTYTGDNPDAWQAMTETDTYAKATVDLAGATYDVRVRIFKDGDASYWSPIKHGTVAADNAPCAAPDEISADIDDGDFTGGTAATLNVVVAPREFRVASVRLQRRIKLSGGAFDSWATIADVDAALNDEIPFTDSVPASTGDDTDIEWRLQSLTSDGTAGAALTYTADIN